LNKYLILGNYHTYLLKKYIY